MPTSGEKRKFTCDICGDQRQFASSSSLYSHKQKHQTEVHCDPCDQWFPNDCSYQNHNAKMHSENGLTYACELCGRRFYVEEALKVHMKRHTEGNKFVCEHCPKRFSNPTGLKYHTYTHTGEKPYRCQDCDKCFRTPSERVEHIRGHTGEKPYQCKQCDKTFRQATGLRTHVARHHTKEKPHQCQFCTKTFTTKGDRTTHERFHTGERPYSCTFCDFAFATIAERNMHVRHAHTKEKPYQCQFCPKSFCRSDDVKNHFERLHSGEKPYKCEECDKYFATSSNRSKHVKTMHKPKPQETGELKYQCDVCPQQYRSYISLYYHKEIHRVPPKCEVCGKIFIHKHNLKAHIIRMHSEGKRKHICSYCQKPFHRESDLKKHMQSCSCNPEKRFVCSQSGCKAKFSDKKYLKMHSNGVHGDKKAYQCQVCKKFFATKRRMLVHERIHTGEKPFSCTFCDFRSKDHPNLMSHMKHRHLKEKSCICQDCGKTFVSTSEVKSHYQRIHLGWKNALPPCNLCGKQFQSKAERVAHLIKHCKKFVVLLETNL